MPLIIASGMQLLTDICEALPLGDMIRAVTIRVSVDDVPMIEVERYIPDDDCTDLKVVLQKYELHPISPPVGTTSTDPPPLSGTPESRSTRVDLTEPHR